MILLYPHETDSTHYYCIQSLLRIARLTCAYLGGSLALIMKLENKLQQVHITYCALFLFLKRFILTSGLVCEEESLWAMNDNTERIFILPHLIYDLYTA